MIRCSHIFQLLKDFKISRTTNKVARSLTFQSSFQNCKNIDNELLHFIFLKTLLQTLTVSFLFSRLPLPVQKFGLFFLATFAKANQFLRHPILENTRLLQVSPPIIIINWLHLKTKTTPFIKLLRVKKIYTLFIRSN